MISICKAQLAEPARGPMPDWLRPTDVADPAFHELWPDTLHSELRQLALLTGQHGDPWTAAQAMDWESG